MAEAGAPATPGGGAPGRGGAGVKGEAGETPALSRNCIPGPRFIGVPGEPGRLPLLVTSLRGKAWAQAATRDPCPSGQGLFRIARPDAFPTSLGRLPI